MNPRPLFYASGTAFLMIAAGVTVDYLYSSRENDGGQQVTRSAPGPVAAVGLPAAGLVGGYFWLRRRSRNRNAKK